MHMHMNLSESGTRRGIVGCPNLLEWNEWGASYCRLRYKIPDVLTRGELQEYCKNTNHARCVFYREQMDMISQNHNAKGE